MTYSLEPRCEGTLIENITKAGVLRRDFMKFCSSLATIFAVGTPMMANAKVLRPNTERIAKVLGEVKKSLMAWLQLQECIGYVESTLRSDGTTVEEVVLNLLSVDYNELAMAASREVAEKALEEVNARDHILVVNGSTPAKDGGIYCTIGGKSAQQVLEEPAENASIILAVGTRTVYGPV